MTTATWTPIFYKWEISGATSLDNGFLNSDGVKTSPEFKNPVYKGNITGMLLSLPTFTGIE